MPRHDRDKTRDMPCRAMQCYSHFSFFYFTFFSVSFLKFSFLFFQFRIFFYVSIRVSLRLHFRPIFFSQSVLVSNYIHPSIYILTTHVCTYLSIGSLIFLSLVCLLSCHSRSFLFSFSFSHVNDGFYGRGSMYGQARRGRSLIGWTLLLLLLLPTYYYCYYNYLPLLYYYHYYLSLTYVNCYHSPGSIFETAFRYRVVTVELADTEEFLDTEESWKKEIEGANVLHVHARTYLKHQTEPAPATLAENIPRCVRVRKTGCRIVLSAMIRIG